MIKQGETVEILPKFQDPGDANYVWVALSNGDGGRVAISPINTGLAIPPVSVVSTSMVKKVK